MVPLNLISTGIRLPSVTMYVSNNWTNTATAWRVKNWISISMTCQMIPWPRGESEMLDSEFELSEIVAAGSPAILTINSRESRIQGEYLRYNLEKNNVEARGAVQQVEILQGPNRFVSQHLNYEISADNSLGKLNAFGPGMMIRQGGNGWRLFAGTLEKSSDDSPHR